MRYYAPIKISDNMRETPEGFLICLNVPIARTGSMIYDETEIPLTADSKGKITVSRSEKEIFSAETIASFEGKPITITHPTEDVTPENWKELAKGEVTNVRRGEGEFTDSLLADLLVKDRVAISLVKSGLREVSCGYDADWLQDEDAPGTGWQELIRGNHLALVDTGRAGHSYAINDQKRKGQRMKLSEKIKAAIFSKGLDEGLKVADAEQTEQDPASGKPAMAKDAMEGLVKTMDAMKASMDAMSEKIASMGAKKSDDAVADPAAKKDEPVKDTEVAPSIEDRMKVVEQGLATMLEKMALGAGTGDEEEDDDSVGDEGEESDDIVGDKGYDSAKGNDAASRAEILSPGIAAGKDLEKRALKAAYATKEGKKVIDLINGGRAPAYDSAENVQTVFTAASELLKATRSQELSRTKQSAGDAGDPTSEPVTAEMMNKKNEEFYKRAH